MNRAEELIPAGSTPNSQNPVDAMHQRQSLLIFVDILVLTYLTYIFTGIWVLQAVLGLLVWSGYRNRRPWAYQGGIMVLLLASLLFALFALFNGYIFIANSDISGLLFMFLMGWASLSSLRHVRIHFHPYYRSIYFGTQMQMSGIQQSEILATCPGCMAILAVDPLQLSPKDKCPQCGTNLVSKETAEAFGYDTSEDE